MIYSAIQINDVCFIRSASTTISHAKLEMMSTISCQYLCAKICKKKKIGFIKRVDKGRITNVLPPFSLIRDFGKQNTHWNVSKISGNHTRYRQIRSKSTIHSPLAWRKKGVTVPVRDNLRAELRTWESFAAGRVSFGCLFSALMTRKLHVFLFSLNDYMVE